MNTPKNRESAMERARDLLADFFDAGVVIMTWEEQGKTYEMHLTIGNDYACESVARRAEEIIYDDSEIESTDL